MNEVVQEWIDKAEADFRTATREFAVSDQPNYDAVCFHTQQCIEKLMKAVLIEFGSTPPKTHDLLQLYRLLCAHAPEWHPEESDLRFLTQAAVGSRYPGDAADYREAEEALRIGTSLHAALLQFLLPTEDFPSAMI